MHSIVRKTFSLILAVLPVALADSLSYWEQQGIININFSEPVVTRTVLENQSRQGASAADKGLDLFSLSGDEAHLPRVVWVEQDCLRIEPVPGTSIKSEYTLRFRADARYLSGRALQQKEYRFHAPASPLLHEDLRTCPNGAALLAARFQQTREAAGLSPETPIQYAYTRLKMDKRGDFFESGETAGAIVEQAKLSHGNSFSVLQSLARRGVKWEDLQQDSPLPGYVVVRPDRPVPAGSIWRLNAKVAPGCGIADSNLGPIYVNRSLSASLEQPGKSETREVDANVLNLQFNSLVERPLLQQAFREMSLKLDGVETTLSEDGKTRTATVNGRELRVRYLGELEPQQFTIKPQDPEDDAVSSSAWDDKETERLVRYSHPTASPGIRLAVESPAPVLVECTLKAGLKGIHQLPLEKDFSCRYSLTPMVPGLPARIEHQLPLHGAHKLKLEAVNGCKVHVRLRHWKADEVLAALPKISSHLEQQTRRGDMALLEYERAVAKARYAAGLEEDEPASPENLTRAREVYRGRQFLVGAGGTVVGQKMLELPAEENGLMGVAPLEVDLDALCGGQPKPGLYLVEMDFYPSVAVQEAARAMGMKPEEWELRCDALVSVSDLAALSINPANIFDHDMLVLRHSTAEPLQEGKLIVVPVEGEGRPAATVPVKQGYVRLPVGEAYLIVRAGEDYFLMSNPGVFNNPDESREQEGAAELRAMVWTDRDIYRPGEKVYVRGFLRAVDGLNHITHSKHRTLELHFEAPDGTRLFSRTFDVDAYGAFSQELTLPAGEEDVCGNYVVRVGTTRPRTLVKKEITCQVYRRDSYEVELEDATGFIAPKELCLKVKAVDLNGLPVGDAHAELRVVSNVPLQGSHLEGRENPQHVWQGRLPVSAEGVAEFKLPLAEKVSGIIEVQYQGSVVNSREEYHTFREHGLYEPAEVRPVLRSDNTLQLLCNCCGELFNGGMSVRVALRVPKRSEKQLANGFALHEYRQEEVWSQWVNVPASCEEGVQLPLAEIMAQHADPEAATFCTVEIKGRDYQGREFRREIQRVYQNDSRRALGQQVFEIRPSGKPGHIIVENGKECKVLLALMYGSRVQAHTLDLQRGYHEFMLPLHGDEEGLVSVCGARLVVDEEASCFDVENARSILVNVQRHRSHLVVDLKLPEGTVRPSTEQTLAGRVTLPDGSPAQAVVTLYAVDEGMLSLSQYENPDVVTELSRWSDGIVSMSGLRTLGAEFQDGRFVMRRRFLPGIWTGEGRTADTTWARQPWWMRDVHAPTTAPSAVMGATSRSAYDVFRNKPSLLDTIPDEAPSTPLVRHNFNPVALWCSALKTDADGRFTTTCKLPDTLTTYRVIAVAADKGGSRFGTQEGEFTVNQPLILRAGTPLFMSVGDRMQLPVTLTNNTEAEGTWQVQLEGIGEPQQVTLPAGASTTLTFEVQVSQVGTATCRWVATGTSGQDAVEGSFEVRHPAPLLKEAHHLVLEGGLGNLVPREKLAAELAGAPGCEMELYLSANPMLHLQGGVDFLLEEPGSRFTERRAAYILPWLLHDRLAPLCPGMSRMAAWRVPYAIERMARELFKYQNADGSLPALYRQGEGDLMTSAHVAMVLRVTEERGHKLPQESWKKLLAYLERVDMKNAHPLTRYAAARALQDSPAQLRALNEVLACPESDWLSSGSVRQDAEFLHYLRTHNEGRHDAFLRWVRSRAADYRHHSSWRSAWSLYSLLTYIGNSKGMPLAATLRLPDGRHLTLDRSATRIQDVVPEGQYHAVSGPVYAVLRAKAQPQQTEYPGVTEHGLQMTRVYEKKGEDGIWRPATEFAVGDVVRVSLTCAKAGEQELRHLVLEDYLPASMEAINPNVPSQAAGLEPLDWSEYFDQREYLADRVRGFCTRWPGSSTVNMRYYARVKRAGSATAPPAQAQLYSEPQVYGLSPSIRLETRPVAAGN